jgi:hypothetical protein
LDKLRHRLQRLQLPHQPPRHEKNADTNPDREQHKENCTTHPVEPATTATGCGRRQAEITGGANEEEGQMTVIPFPPRLELSSAAPPAIGRNQ